MVELFYIYDTKLNNAFKSEMPDKYLRNAWFFPFKLIIYNEDVIIFLLVENIVNHAQTEMCNLLCMYIFKGDQM